jgi:hypothetical protein
MSCTVRSCPTPSTSLPTPGASSLARWCPAGSPTTRWRWSSPSRNPKAPFCRNWWAQWHTDDLLNNRALDGDIGSNGNNPKDRAGAAGYHGTVAETVAINPALAISSLELLRMWYANPAYVTIMQDCTNTDIGVWSESSLDRTVVVAVYGSPAI